MYQHADCKKQSLFSIRVPTILAELPEKKNCESFIKKHNCDKEEVQIFDIYCRFFVCTSPLAVITVVGLLDVLPSSLTTRSR